LGRSSRRRRVFGRAQRITRLARVKRLDGRRRVAKAGRPLTRETSAGEARRAGRSLGFSRRRSAACPGRKARARGMPERRVAPPGSDGRHGGWRQTHPEVSSKSGASWARRAGDLGTGIGRSRGCARGLFWLQKSTRGAWSKSARVGPARVTGTKALGLACRPRALCTCSAANGCPKPARGGKAASTVAGCR
jgi:hypothetical protein